MLGSVVWFVSNSDRKEFVMKPLLTAAVFAVLAGSASAQCPGGVCPTPARAAFRYVVQSPARVVAAVAPPVTIWHPVPPVAPKPMPNTAAKAPAVPVAAFVVAKRPAVTVHRFAPLATFLHNRTAFGFFVR